MHLLFRSDFLLREISLQSQPLYNIVKMRLLLRCLNSCYFFFSSRRRHTRYWRDWSSDVCSSDLSFLGIAGAIAVRGYDGFLFSIGFLVAWLLALLLVAELTRNTGRYTMGDVLAYRMHRRPVRAAAAISTLVVSAFYLLAQMAGAGGLIALLLQIPADDRIGQGVVIAVVGA